jgi:hypothetical protein
LRPAELHRYSFRRMQSAFSSGATPMTRKSPRRFALLAALAGMAAALPAAAQNRGQASALVEDVKSAPGAGVDFMDYVYPGQRITLGGQGQLVLDYFQSCRVETIRGGTVSVGATESTVQGGQLRAATRACDPKKFAATTQTAEAGAAVKRLETPFDRRTWSETTLKSAKPIFRWQAAAGPVTVKVVDQDSKQVVWSAQTAKTYIEYPARGPALQPGIPYGVEVSGGSGTMGARFSIDPDLDLAETPLNRTVPVTP